MIPWRTAGRTTRRRVVLRRAPAAAVCLLALWLVPASTAGLQALGPGDAGTVLRAAVALAAEGELDRAGTSLSEALRLWPDHPELLAGLAGLRLRQGRPAEAEALAGRLVRIDATSDHGWELLAGSRYLQDDTRGALRAWSHRRPLVVRELEVRVLAHDGPRTSDAGTDPARLTGMADGGPLTEGTLVRGERRLGALPAASSARLEYRPLGAGGAGIEGTVVLRARNPFTRPAVVAHALRALVGRIDVGSSDPLGRLERWELLGTVEGTTHSVSLALSHPALRGPGVWRWAVAHGAGRYAAKADAVVREERGSVAWSHADWITGWLRGSARGQVESRPGRGTFAGAGVGGTLLSLTGRSSLHAEGMGWTRMGDAVGGDGSPEGATRFGRLALRAALHPAIPPGVSAPSGVALQGGLVAVSSGAPHDLLPRIGAGGHASLLMRARSDLDGDGVVRPLFPGRAWAHASVELLRGVGSVGPLGLGLAAFADGVRVLASAPVDPDARRGAIHLGVGVRARIPGVEGWLRADWGIDPVDGASRLSAGWVRRGPSW